MSLEINLTIRQRISIFLGAPCFLVTSVWLLALVSVMVPSGLIFMIAQVFTWIIVIAFTFVLLMLAVSENSE